MTTDPLILLFLALHIISAGIWLGQFVAEFAVGRFVQRVKGQVSEVATQMAGGLAAQMMGMIGGIGILITGLLLTLQFHYGILGIGGVYTPMWLAAMQILFVIAMGITGALITPNSRKALVLLQQALTSNQPVPAEAQALLNRITLASRLVSLLVLITIFLGVFGVNGGFMT